MTIDRGKVEALLTEACNRYSRMEKNYGAWFGKQFLSPYLLIGTGSDEIRRTKEEIQQQYERDFDEASDIQLSYVLTDFVSTENICWGGGTMLMEGIITGNEIIFNLRFTMVVQKVEGELFFRQMHVSAPQSGITMGESWPTPMGMKEQIEWWIENFEININLSEELRESKLKEYLVKAQTLIEEAESH